MTEFTPHPSWGFKYIFLILIALIWGSQFMVNKLVLNFFTPEGLAFLRAFIACLTLSSLIPFSSESKTTLSGSPPYTKKLPYILFLIGFFEATLPFYLISEGQLFIASAVTSILMASIPLFVLLLVFLFLKKQEQISIAKLLGVALGFVGVIVLLSPDLKAGLGDLHLKGDLDILGGAFCFASSLVLIRAFVGPELPPIRTARAILFSAVIQLGLISLIRWQPFWHGAPTLINLIGILGLGIFAGGIVYVLYVILIRTAGATFTGFTNYLVPLVGVLLGVLVLNEPLHIETYIGLLIILLSVGLCEF